MKNPDAKLWLLTLVATAISLSLISPAASADMAKGDSQGASTQNAKIVEVAGYTRDIIDDMDADKNHEVSKAEFMDFMSREFDRLDVNHDGKLQQSEILNKSMLGQQKTSVSRR